MIIDTKVGGHTCRFPLTKFMKDNLKILDTHIYIIQIHNMIQKV